MCECVNLCARSFTIHIEHLSSLMVYTMPWTLNSILTPGPIKIQLINVRLHTTNTPLLIQSVICKSKSVSTKEERKEKYKENGNAFDSVYMTSTYIWILCTTHFRYVRVCVCVCRCHPFVRQQITKMFITLKRITIGIIKFQMRWSEKMFLRWCCRIVVSHTHTHCYGRKMSSFIFKC